MNPFVHVDFCGPPSLRVLTLPIWDINDTITREMTLTLILTHFVQYLYLFAPQIQYTCILLSNVYGRNTTRGSQAIDLETVKFKQSKRNIGKVARNGEQGSNVAFHSQVVTMKHSHQLTCKRVTAREDNCFCESMVLKGQAQVECVII